MTQNKRVAITGGIGSGKSAFCAFLKEEGFPVFSCDEINRELRRDPSYLASLAARFPDCALRGEVDFAKLSEKVFSDRASLLALNALSHPLIMDRLLQKMTAPLSFAEVPLLFEGGFEGMFDAVVVLLRSEAARLRDVQMRDRLSEEQVLSRMKSQIDWNAPPPGCIIVSNDGCLADLKKAARELISSLNGSEFSEQMKHT